MQDEGECTAERESASQMNFAYECWGVRFCVAWSDPCLDSLISTLRVATWTPIAPEEADWVFWVTGDSQAGWVVAGPDDEVAAPSQIEWLASLERRLSLAIAIRARQVAFIHAGAIAWEGKGLILPGRSHVGKSTLVREFMQSGATYYSDEYAIIDTSGMLHPYPRRLALRIAGGGEERVSFDGLTGLGPVPVHLIVTSRFIPSSDLQQNPVSAGAACLHLTQNAVAAVHSPAQVLACIGATAAKSSSWEVIRGEARPAVDWMLDQLSSRRDA